MKRFFAIALIVLALTAPATAHAVPVIAIWAWEYTSYAFCELCSGCECSGEPSPHDWRAPAGDPIDDAYSRLIDRWADDLALYGTRVSWPRSIDDGDVR
jgi:hypothetical protein